MTAENTPDIKLSLTKENIVSINRVLSYRSKMLGRVGSYEFKGISRFSANRGLGNSYVGSIYDLSEIGRAVDVEPYVIQSIRKHREQILKEGYLIKGTDDDKVSYIRKRLFEISLVSDIPTSQIVRDIVTNLVTYHNAFIVFRRDDARSSGRPIKIYGKEILPIAGLFIADPTTMEVLVDKYGTPRRYRQKIVNRAGTEEDKTFQAEDVIHITVDKKAGYSYGTPYILPVLDDIRALRKLEELAVVLASKEAFPLYHYTVGNDEQPAILYDDGTSEIDIVESKIENLPAQGFVITSNRHKVELVSRQGASLDIQPFIEYFESRVLAGLRLAEIDLGRGGTSNRGTASSISKNVQDSAKDYQQVISDTLTFKLILPLLLEGGFDIIESEEVKLDFPTIDREELRAHQTHGLNMYMSSAISRNEFRKEYLNKEAMAEEDQGDTQMAYELERELKVIAATPRPATSTGGSRTSTASRSSANLTRSLVQPVNQFKKLQSKPRIPANDYSEFIHNVTSHITQIKSDIINLEDDIELVQPEVRSIIHSLIEKCTEESKNIIDSKIKEGWEKVLKDNDDPDLEVDQIGSRSLDRFYRNFIRKSYWLTVNPFIDSICSSFIKDQEGKMTSYNAIRHLEGMRLAIKDLVNNQLETSYRFGYVSLAKRVGYKQVSVKDKENNTLRNIEVQKIIYTQLLPKPNEVRLTIKNE